MRSHIRTVVVLALAACLVVRVSSQRRSAGRGARQSCTRGRRGWRCRWRRCSSTWRSERCAGSTCSSRSADRRFAQRVPRDRGRVCGQRVLPARAGEVIRPYFLARHGSRDDDAPPARSRRSSSSACSTSLTVLALLASFVFVFGRERRRRQPDGVRGGQVGRRAPPARGALAALVVLFVLAGDPGAAWPGAGAARAGAAVGARRPASRGSPRNSRTGSAPSGARAGCCVALLLSFPLWLSIALGIWAVADGVRLRRAVHRVVSADRAARRSASRCRRPARSADSTRRSASARRCSSARRTMRRSAPRSCCTCSRSARRCCSGCSSPRRTGLNLGSMRRLADQARAGAHGIDAMKCPYCGHLGDKVVDSRESKEGEVIRRRRECLDCGKRFTSYERIDEIPYMVVKKDGTRERFDRAEAGRRAAEGVREAAGQRRGARSGRRPRRGDAAGTAGEGNRDRRRSAAS